jgi:hypothetical protein
LYEKYITVDIYAIACEVVTKLQFPYVRGMVSFSKRGSEAYGFLTLNCSKA